MRKTISTLVSLIEELIPCGKISNFEIIEFSILDLEVRGNVFIESSFLRELVIWIENIFDEIWCLNSSCNEDFISKNSFDIFGDSMIGNFIESLS